jgi:cob(I)alamin adenosyltransferase
VIEMYRKIEGIVVAADDKIKGRQGYGLIQLFTGNGKGKTTAAIGEAVRAAGAGKKVAVIFFDKGGEHYSERAMLETLGIEWFAYGRDRIDAVTGRFDFSVTDEDKALGSQGLNKAREILASNHYDLLVLDEINSSTDLGFLSEQEVLSLLDIKTDKIELVLTGRNVPQSFIDRAHLVTDMRLRKHYFYSGVKAREGLDY